jgi:hypothetical protein
MKGLLCYLCHVAALHEHGLPIKQRLLLRYADWRHLLQLQRVCSVLQVLYECNETLCRC